jgi:hypothetical protein
MQEQRRKNLIEPETLRRHREMYEDRLRRIRMVQERLDQSGKAKGEQMEDAEREGEQEANLVTMQG